MRYCQKLVFDGFLAQQPETSAVHRLCKAKHGSYHRRIPCPGKAGALRENDFLTLGWAPRPRPRFLSVSILVQSGKKVGWCPRFLLAISQSLRGAAMLSAIISAQYQESCIAYLKRSVRDIRHFVIVCSPFARLICARSFQPI
jgi:hypothetical protein